MIERAIQMLRPLGRRLPPRMKEALLRLYRRWTAPSPQAALQQALAARAEAPSLLTPVAPVAAEVPVGAEEASASPAEEPAAPPAVDANRVVETVDLIISPNEISFSHGTGVLLSRLAEGRSDIIVMRSRTDYGGAQRVDARDAFVLPAGLTDRQAIFSYVLAWLAPYRVRTILCAPYFETDLVLAIAAQAVTGAPLGLWIMDDNCLNTGRIAKPVMAEAIARADALFAISPELKRTYQSEFRRPMAVLPPLVAPGLVRSEPSPPATGDRLVMIGNVWSGDLLDELSRVVEAARLRVDWYASNPELWSGRLSLETLRERGIHVLGKDDPETLARAVVEARAVLVPSDSGRAGKHEAALGAMSLPTRMPFVLATAGTPLIVVSRPGTAAALFVERFDVGRVVPYDGEALAGAVTELASPEVQGAMRARAAEAAPRFSFEGAFDFVFGTILAGGRWPDDRFETLFPPSTAYSIFVDKPPRAQFARDFGDVINLCDRLKSAGFRPDFIIDIGASTGIWSLAVATVFEEPRYILCDPMFSRYGQLWTKPHFELVEAAISDEPGEATFSVSSDLYGSSLINVSGVVAVADKVTVPMLTVDGIARERKLEGRGLVKVDVQYAEHLVIEGARETLKAQADVVILELTLARVHPKARTLLEIANTMDELGFRIFDEVGSWRLPATGEMDQLDLAFVRKTASFAQQDVA